MTIFNLPTDVVEEIFSRVPMKSTRSVCKTLNTLSQSPSFTKLHIGKDTATTKEGETRIIVLMDYNLHLISVVFNGIGTDPSSEHKDPPLDVTPHWCKMFCNPGVSLKGNTYFCASMRNVEEEDGVDDHIICFDFTSESFGPLLHLPFSAGVDDYVTLSCLREEKLAVSLAHNEVNPYEFDIWISTKIEAEKVSWSKFLRVETEFDITAPFISGSYFIDEEKKVAIGFDDMNYHRLNIIGDVGYFRQVDVGEREPADRNCRPDLCVYVPSLVQIKQPAGGERTQQSDIEKCRFDQYMSRLAAFEGKSSGRMMRVENESAWGYEKEKTPASF